MARPEMKPFYGSRAWQAARMAALKRDRFSCQLCGQRAQEVHHLIELNESNVNDPNVSLNLKNLQSLCHDCHTKITSEAHKAGEPDAGKGFFFDANGFLQPRAAGGHPPVPRDFEAALETGGWTSEKPTGHV